MSPVVHDDGTQPKLRVQGIFKDHTPQTQESRERTDLEEWTEYTQLSHLSFPVCNGLCTET